MITAAMQGESLVIEGRVLVSGPDLIDLLHLGRTVPVFSAGEQSGEAELEGNLIRVTGENPYQIRKKYLFGLLEGRVPEIIIHGVGS